MHNVFNIDFIIKVEDALAESVFSVTVTGGLLTEVCLRNGKGAVEAIPPVVARILSGDSYLSFDKGAWMLKLNLRALQGRKANGAFIRQA